VVHQQFGVALPFSQLLSAVSARVRTNGMTVTYSAPGNRFHQVYQAFSEGEFAVTSESTKTFSRMFRGYNPAAVDTYIEVLTTKQQMLLDDVESLKARLKEAGDQGAELRKEIATLTDSSPSPHAMQHRMAKMMRRAVDEVSEMQAESRAEADALIGAAEAEVEAAQRKHRQLVADMTAQRKTLEADFKDNKKKLEVELGGMRAETQAAIDALWQEAQQDRERLIADAKLEADHYREQAQRAVDEASQQRIYILERLMGVYSDLEAVPATLQLAYQERRNAPEGTVVVPLGQSNQRGVSSRALVVEGSR
jgi:cell division septum initiation protein DivIVA